MATAEDTNTAHESQKVSETPRVAIFSSRSFETHVSRSHGYEFEDAITALDHADIYAPSARRGQPALIKLKNRLSYRSSALAAAVPSGLEALDATRDYALFFCTLAQLRELNHLNAVRNWRQRARFAICWLQELWVNELETLSVLVDRLNMFDVVICSFAQTASALQDRLRTPVHYIPWGLDAVHFCPEPNPPRRAIDLLNIGVRHPATHAALVDYADRNGHFYLYETISGRAGMADYNAHRHNYIGLIQRSRYFFSFLAKVERQDERGTQIEFGLRYLEGLAAGAVILGTKIDSDAFRTHLGWDNSVIETPYECPDIGARIDQLNADPNALAEMSRRNVRECLTRHDHLHRWQILLDLAGLEPTAAMLERKTCLEALAAEHAKGGSL